MAESQSVREIMQAINAALTNTDYRCQTVSWDDVERGTVGGGLSCWGANITDTRLWEKSGKTLYTVRSQNWNEKLGSVSANEIALMAGGVRESEPPRPVTLADYLANIGSHGSYAGLSSVADLSDKALDAKVSIRFQTTFLPVPDEEFGALEFAPEMYNYQTRSDADPKNLLLLCTTQGSALQQDGAGAKKLFHHALDPAGKAGQICRYWFEAERTKHSVGGPQIETKEEKEAALARGKAVSAVIGTRAMGTRFNVLMTVQVPLEQQRPEPTRSFAVAGCGLKKSAKKGFAGFSFPGLMSKGGPSLPGGQSLSKKLSVDSDDSEDVAMWSLGVVEKSVAFSPPVACASHSVERFRCMPRSVPEPRRAKASAARVSRGSQADTWQGLSVKAPKRDARQHVTVTVVIYNTVAGGVPSPEDVAAAIADMDALYASCGWTGALASEGANFMKSELTVGDALKIAAKVTTQPYKPDSLAPQDADVFPTSITV
jgi:huntingtin